MELNLLSIRNRLQEFFEVIQPLIENALQNFNSQRLIIMNGNIAESDHCFRFGELV